MADSPPLAGYAGTFSGSPVTINPWTDHGFVSNQTILIPTGAHGLTVTMGANTLQVPAGVILSIPGALNSFILNGTATEGWIAYCAGQPIAGLVSAIFGGGSGGGGGGGAPTTAPYLLDTDTVPGALTAGVAVRNISVPIDFIFPAGAPGGAATPFRLYGSDVSQPPTTGGGVRLPFRWTSTSGEQTVAIIGAEFTDVSVPAHPKAALAFALGEAETLAMLLQLNNLDFTQAMQIQSAARLALSGVGGATVVTLEAAGVVEFAQDTTIQTAAASGKRITLVADTQIVLQSTTSPASLIAKDSTRAAQLISGSGGGAKVVAVTASTNSLACSGVEIQNIADGAASDSAATVGQLNTNASVGYMTFGAVSTGTIADALYLLGGAGWDVAQASQSAKSVWIAVAPGKVQAGRIHADTGPIVGGADTYQRFEVYKNGSPTGCFCNLPAGANSGVLVGTFTFVAGDGIGVVATCQGDAGDVGAVGVLCNIAFTNG